MAWLKGLRLSLQSWLLVTAASIIGGLVVLLRARGSQLHKAQVTALKESFGRVQDKHDAAVESARTRFEKASKAYDKEKRK